MVNIEEKKEMMKKSGRVSVTLKSNVIDLLDYITQLKKIKRSDVISLALLEYDLKNSKIPKKYQSIRDLEKIKYKSILRVRRSSTRDLCFLSNSIQMVLTLGLKQILTCKKLNMNIIQNYIDKTKEAYKYMPEEIQESLKEDYSYLLQLQKKSFLSEQLNFQKTVTSKHYQDISTRNMIEYAQNKRRGKK